MKTVDLLQVVYEHWAKPRDIEENKILKSSIGSPLPTFLHCVICKSNNLFKSLFLSFFLWSLSASQIAGGLCLKMNAFRMSGSWGHLWQGERIFFSCFKIYFYVKTWDRLGKYASIEWLLVFVVTTVHILFVLHRPATSVSLVKSCIFFKKKCFYLCQIRKGSLRDVTCHYGVC